MCMVTARERHGSQSFPRRMKSMERNNVVGFKTGIWAPPAVSTLPVMATAAGNSEILTT